MKCIVIALSLVIMSCDNHPCGDLEIIESDEIYFREIEQYPNLKNALETYNVKKDFKNALNLLEPMAYKGCAIAQFKIAALYDMGWGVEQNTDKATFWYIQSEIGGHETYIGNWGTRDVLSSGSFYVKIESFFQKKL